VTLLTEGEKLAKVLTGNKPGRRGETVFGWWGRLDQFKKGRSGVGVVQASTATAGRWECVHLLADEVRRKTGDAPGKKGKRPGGGVRAGGGRLSNKLLFAERLGTKGRKGRQDVVVHVRRRSGPFAARSEAIRAWGPFAEIRAMRSRSPRRRRSCGRQGTVKGVARRTQLRLSQWHRTAHLASLGSGSIYCSMDAAIRAGTHFWTANIPLT